MSLLESSNSIEFRWNSMVSSSHGLNGKGIRAQRNKPILEVLKCPKLMEHGR